MKKKIIVPLFFIAGLLIGFISGGNNTYEKNTSYTGFYTEKNIQDKTDPFQIELSEESYQYSDPVHNVSGKGQYEILDDGIIAFTSGDLKNTAAISESKFMKDTTLTMLDSYNKKVIVLVKVE